MLFKIIYELFKFEVFENLKKAPILKTAISESASDKFELMILYASSVKQNTGMKYIIININNEMFT